ncbi:hypothetical protein V6N13_035449 [Hibiscus sabdariffa]|uniref:Uncharacterized protein n=1 Tax=Hibiscus sabdariffa TaxID=183260 RepID=A0ABR2S9E5_9ROSI
MTTQKSLLLFLTFLIIMGFSGFTSCRHIKQESSEEIDRSLGDKYAPMFFRSFAAIYGTLGKPAGGTGTISSVHAVSHRLVPGGPNPLHN